MGTNSTITEIRRLLDAQTCVHFSSGSVAVTTTPAVLTLGEEAGLVAGSENLPQNWIRLVSVEFGISAIAAGATGISWYLCRQTSGASAITPRIMTNWYVYSGTNANAAVILDLPYRWLEDTNVDSEHNIYISMATNMGTATVAVTLNWLSNSHPPALTVI